MTRLLILTRHAKSSWDDLFLPDHDRPLNKRGRKSAPAVGAWLKSNNWVPDEVVSSTSVRTRETWERMGLAAHNVHFTRDLYHAAPDEMLGVLRGTTGQTVMMLAHNPGIAIFADHIVRNAPKHPRFHDYPTCATTVIQFAFKEWAEADWHSGDVKGFAIPRELLK